MYRYSCRSANAQVRPALAGRHRSRRHRFALSPRERGSPLTIQIGRAGQCTGEHSFRRAVQPEQRDGVAGRGGTGLQAVVEHQPAGADGVSEVISVERSRPTARRAPRRASRRRRRGIPSPPGHRSIREARPGLRRCARRHSCRGTARPAGTCGDRGRRSRVRARARPRLRRCSNSCRPRDRRPVRCSSAP